MEKYYNAWYNELIKIEDKKKNLWTKPYFLFDESCDIMIVAKESNESNEKLYKYPDNFQDLYDDCKCYKEKYLKNPSKTDTFIKTKNKSITDLISEDILRCEQYFKNKENEEIGRELYLDITARYDSVIKGFGQGLYQYISEHHFYEPEIDIETLNHNLRILLQKMISHQAVNGGEKNSKKAEHKKAMSNKVFIVHGHDEAAKEAMARTIIEAKLEPIILHEQASSGKTIIEKIEEYSDVAFAVVLYTECDFGCAKTDKVENEKYRARQNVVFEHGYLIAKLGRKRVCALVKGDVETPGDISGVVYIPMDNAGGWKIKLAKEMKEVGINIDMNKF